MTPAAEGEGADSAFLRPGAHKLDVGLRGVRLVDELGQERRVDAAPPGGAVVEGRRVPAALQSGEPSVRSGDQ